MKKLELTNSKDNCVFLLMSSLPPEKFYHVYNINHGHLKSNTLMSKGFTIIMCFLNVFNHFSQK